MLFPEDILQDRYRIVRRLGHGGMGAVYEAIDRRLKSTVAIKETFATTEAGRLAFRHEAERLANLDHEVFPKVSNYFDEGEGLYLVMQLVRGEDLEERLRERLKYQEGPFSQAKVLEWADQLLDALEELHKYNPPIIHRDIKPSNLKMNQRGKIILLDFGIAKGAIGQMSALKTDGSIGGATPHFAPLEQVLKIDPSSVKTLSTISHEAVENVLREGTDPRSDLYALGATLYRLLTGEVPDDARLRAIAIWAGRRDPLQPACEVNSQVSQSVSQVLMQAMALDRSNRPADAATMRRMLREAVGAPLHLPPTMPSPEELERQRREEEARRRAQAETERLRREEEERQRAEEETRRRETEAQQREAQEAARRAAEEERQRKEAEEREKLEAEEAVGRAERERQRAEQERLKREALEAERKRAAEREEKERAAAAQRTAPAPTQPAQAQTPPDAFAVKTIKAPPPERVALPDEKPASRFVEPAGRNRRAMLIGVAVLFVFVIVVAVVLMRRGEGNSNQSSNANQARTGQEAGTNPNNSNNAVASPAVQNTNANNSNKAAASPVKPRQTTPNIEMVYVQGGTFLMGSLGSSKDEQPRHNVTVQSFYMGKYEVTQAQYRVVMEENPSHFVGCDECPVEDVEWNDTQEFIRRLNGMQSKYSYRLPSEAEWEYACRAGTTGDYAGDLDAMAWYAGNSDNKTHLVGRKSANGFGLYDLHGNVWEWCEDTWHENYSGAPADGSGWMSDGDSSIRVLRGGSWFNNAPNLRSAYRSKYSPGLHGGNVGFRVVAVSRSS